MSLCACISGSPTRCTASLRTILQGSNAGEYRCVENATVIVEAYDVEVYHERRFPRLNDER